MLKPILILSLIAFSLLFPQQQTPSQASPDLLAIKFSWAKGKENVRMIRGAQNPGGHIVTPVPDNRDLMSRKADIRNTEKRAIASAQQQNPNVYQLWLEVKNTGSKVVTSFIWEFRPTATPDDYASKQYLCALNVKPNEKKKFDLWTPYAPVKVVSVKPGGDALKEGEVIINKIEYQDGSVWKRDDWYYALPPESSKNLSEGKCSVFSS